MQTLTLTLKPLSAFGTLPLGDTLFGQLCWLLREHEGEAKLTELLQDYTTGNPFAVVSDAFPSGYVPRPTVPLSYLRENDGNSGDRKAVKKKVWLPESMLAQPCKKWLESCVSEKDVLAKWQENLPEKEKTPKNGFLEQELQQHNSISRLTGTTGQGQFAPYTLDQYWYGQGTKLNVHIVFDEGKISAEQLRATFKTMGLFGFGRDASIGLGKFELLEAATKTLPAIANANAVLTLAPCAPQGCGFDAKRSYYQLFTRFGRHGGSAVQSGNPFKTPVLMANTGAVFSSNLFNATTLFVGQGLGGLNDKGEGILSKQIPATVQQGYAPVIPIHFPAQEHP